MKTSHASSKRGFTLVELLVVISLIALMIAILLPALGQARSTAVKVQCLTQQKQIMNGWLSYANDFKGWFPQVNNLNQMMVTSAPTSWMLYLNYSQTGLDQPIILKCPGTKLISSNPVVGNKYIAGTLYGAGAGANAFSSYVFAAAWGNANTPPYQGAVRYFFGFDNGSTFWTSSPGNPGAPCPNVNFAGQIVDGQDHSVANAIDTRVWIDQPSVQPALVDCWNCYGLSGGWTSNGAGASVYLNSHADGVNIAFIDGHAAFRQSTVLSQRYRCYYW